LEQPLCVLCENHCAFALKKGTGKKVTADSETRELCIKAVAAINGLNFAGVDVMKDTDGKDGFF